MFRSIQIAPVWRAERPQKGRYRQFMQCDIDIIGEAGAAAEIELIVATLADARRPRPRRAHGPHQRPASARPDARARWASPRRAARRVLITIDKLDKIGTGRSGRRAAREPRPSTGDADVFAARDLDATPYGERQIRGSAAHAARRVGRTPICGLALRAALAPTRRHRRSTRSSCAAWGTTPARSSSSPTPTSTTRSAAAAATTA